MFQKGDPERAGCRSAAGAWAGRLLLKSRVWPVSIHSHLSMKAAKKSGKNLRHTT
jgi:hypothetical protein